VAFDFGARGAAGDDADEEGFFPDQRRDRTVRISLR
jgi:hypothetical protein